MGLGKNFGLGGGVTGVNSVFQTTVHTYYDASPLRHIFGSNKDHIPINEKSGVYFINCPSVYIGETGRQFTTRINEHLDAWRKFSTPRETTTSSSSSKRYFKRLALEEYEIIRQWSNPDFIVLNRNLPENSLATSLF